MQRKKYSDDRLRGPKVPSFIGKIFMLNEEKIKNLLHDLVEGTPLFIVDVKVKPNDRVVIEADSDNGITVDECASLNHALQAALESESVNAEVEVSSPGLGKPLRVLRQYLKCKGRPVMVQLLEGTTLQGVLKHADEKEIVLSIPARGKKKPESEPSEQTVSMREIKSTKEIIQF